MNDYIEDIEEVIEFIHQCDKEDAEKCIVAGFNARFGNHSIEDELKMQILLELHKKCILSELETLLKNIK